MKTGKDTEVRPYWMLVGPPGSGKGTQGRRLSDAFGVALLSTGDLLRDAVRADTCLGRTIREVMESGRYVDDATMLELVQDWVAPRQDRGYILDGFPRTLPQLHAFMDAAIRVDQIVHIQVPASMLLQRLTGRQTHLASGRIYHRIYNPPKVAGRDDMTGEPLIVRPDDADAAVRTRLRVYNESTGPMLSALEDLSREGRVCMHTVDGTASVTEVARSIQRRLGIA